MKRTLFIKWKKKVFCVTSDSCTNNLGEKISFIGYVSILSTLLVCYSLLYLTTPLEHIDFYFNHWLLDVKHGHSDTIFRGNLLLPHKLLFYDRQQRIFYLHFPKLGFEWCFKCLLFEKKNSGFYVIPKCKHK